MSACEGAVVYGGFDEIHRILYLSEKNWRHNTATFDYWFHATFQRYITRLFWSSNDALKLLFRKIPWCRLEGG